MLALGYLLAGRRYPLDTLATPGPGIFPLAAGLALLALAVWQLLAGGRRPAPAAAGEADDVEISRAPLIMSAVLALYAAALPRLGFTLTSFALVSGRRLADGPPAAGGGRSCSRSASPWPAV